MPHVTLSITGSLYRGVGIGGRDDLPKVTQQFSSRNGSEAQAPQSLGLLWYSQRSVLKPQMQGEEQSCFHSEAKSQLCHLLACNLGRVMRRQVNSTHLW